MAYRILSKNVCKICTREIVIQIRKGTGICSENCEKKERVGSEA